MAWIVVASLAVLVVILAFVVYEANSGGSGVQHSVPNQPLRMTRRAVEYLHRVQPPGLDLKPIDMALACRNEKCTAEDVFALRADLSRHCERAISYISVNGR